MRSETKGQRGHESSGVSRRVNVISFENLVMFDKLPGVAAGSFPVVTSVSCSV